MDPLEAVGDRELRATFSFVLAHARPVTADELAAAQRSHRNVARSRLERLADAGLLIRGAERRTGRVGPGAGRPAKTYAVAPQLRAIEFPDRRYEKLVRLMADWLPAESRGERLRTFGVAFAQELLQTLRPRPAKTLADGAERICAAVRTLGFHASVAEVGDGNVVIETAACPLRPLVRESPAIADVDRGMWIGLAEWALDGVDAEQLECGTHRCLGAGSCRVTLTVSDTPS